MFDLSKVNLKIKEAVETYSQKYNIPENFLYALIKTESGFNEYALRYEKNYKWIVNDHKIFTRSKLTSIFTFFEVQKFSYGLCQIMGNVFYENGFTEPPARFYDIYINIDCCCRHLSGLVKRKKLNFDNQAREIYDAYNSGVVNYDDGNEKNVDRFMSNYLLFNA